MYKVSVLVLAVLLITAGCSNGDALDSLRASYEAELNLLENEVTTLTDDLQSSQEMLAEKEKEITALIEKVQGVEEEKADLMGAYETLKTEHEALMNQKNGVPDVVALSEVVVELIRDQDFATLSTYVDPSLGLRFSPYPYIDLGSDLVMSPAQVSAFGTDTSLYNWGNYDGSGDPIDLTPMDYYSTFVYNADFADPEMMSWNAPIGTGNMINNLTTVYPTADYVEFYFSGFDPAYTGMDWTGLTLVFEQVGPDWYLVGVVHGQWTI